MRSVLVVCDFLLDKTSVRHTRKGAQRYDTTVFLKKVRPGMLHASVRSV